MINYIISHHVLTIGCKYNPPKGGIAVVLNNYKNHVYTDFQAIVNSGADNNLYKLWKAVSALIKLFCKLIFNHEIRIVHIHTASYNSFKRSAWFVKLAKILGRKVVLHIHGGGFKEYYKTNPRWISSILNKCDAIITLTPSWKQYFQEISTCPLITIIPNIIEPPQTNYPKYNDGKFHLLFLGLITEAKGIFDLIEVLNDNVSEFRGKIILHIGGNGKTKQLCDMIERYDIADIVKFEGWVSGNKKAELLSACDAFILPSYTEGLPISILEAMVYGKPVLSTPIGGIPEIIEHGKTGLLFDAGDKDAMFSAIKLLSENRPLCTEMGEAARLRCNDNLPDSVGRVLENMYIKLLE